jgi:N-methylhydantoinase B
MSSSTSLDRTPRYWDGVKRSYIPPDKLEIAPGLKLHQGAEVDVDPITFEVIRYSLLNANFDHSKLLQRLCVSPIVMLTRDFQASVLLEDGELVYMGPNIQYFSNSHSLTIRWILEYRSGAPGIREGDMYLSSDPFVGAPHQPDACLAMPVFVGGELFCWIANVLHYVDVGGASPGSFCITAKDAWSDPPSLPPVRLVEGGVIRQDIEDVFTRQSRLRANVLMDLRAAVAANQKTAERIRELIARYGADQVKTVMRRVVKASESTFTERLAAVPDGRWSARGYAEMAVPGDWNVYRYQINIRKKGLNLFVDNEGTDPQIGAINITHVAFSGAVLTAINQALVPDLAGAYGGAMRRVVFQPKAGLLNSAEHPAAVSPSGVFTTMLNINLATHAVSKMLASGDAATRARTLGASIPHFYCLIYSAVDSAGQTHVFPNTNPMIGSLGAMPDRDGVDAGGHFWIPEGIANNIEQVEADYPILYLYRRFLPGGHDGAGRTRGGLGFEEAVIPRECKSVEINLAINEGFTKGVGMFGGNPGTRASVTVKNGARAWEILAHGRIPRSMGEIGGVDVLVEPKSASIHVDGPTGAIAYISPTTAGFGDPLGRDPAAAVADVEAGLFAPEAVEAVYGIVLRESNGRYSVDMDATRERRDAMRQKRLGHAPTQQSPTPPDEQTLWGSALSRRQGRWICAHCENDLGPETGNYKSAALMTSVGMGDIAPGFSSPHARTAEQMEFRSFFCSGCGARLDTEIARKGDEVLADVEIGA